MTVDHRSIGRAVTLGTSNRLVNTVTRVALRSSLVDFISQLTA
jgi:hypothetical protein